MDKETVVRLHSTFEDMVQRHPETGAEFWCARDLQMLLGYTKWENFAKVIDKAITSCQTAGLDPKDHFLGIRKMVDLGSGAKREIEDIALNRYACLESRQRSRRTPVRCNRRNERHTPCSRRCHATCSAFGQ